MEEFKKLIEKLRKDENVTGVYVILETWMKDYKKYNDSLEYGELKGAIYGLYGAGYITKKDKDRIMDYLNTHIKDYITKSNK